MARVQDLKHLDVVVSRYLNFQMDNLIIGHVIKNIFKEYPLSENMRDNLTLEMYQNDKVNFKRCLVIEQQELTRKATNLGGEGFLAQTIYVKLASLIVKILDSKILKDI